MNNSIAKINDSDFLFQFENQSLDHIYFDHLGHLRIAWLYLNAQDVDSAVHSTCTGIKTYAESLGAKDKFHYTITNAFVRIIAKRIHALNDRSWQGFIRQNNDLVNDAMSVLLLHFSEELIFSEVAKTSIIAPDLREY